VRAVVEGTGLGDPHVQATLLAEAVASADVGFLVWDEDRRYIAANKRACELLGCTLETLLGSKVGERTTRGEALVEGAVRDERARGRAKVRGAYGELELEYLTFRVRTAGVPFMGTIIWPANLKGA
jgi:PAS domain-containing protein